jgi:hypothetical protein
MALTSRFTRRATAPPSFRGTVRLQDQFRILGLFKENIIADQTGNAPPINAVFVDGQGSSTPSTAITASALSSPRSEPSAR